jgi:SAM-dependent methyltransferase
LAGDVCHLPFKAGVIDVVTSYDAMEHVYDPERHVAEMARVLRPGGTFLLSTINHLSYAEFVHRTHEMELGPGDYARVMVDYLLRRDPPGDLLTYTRARAGRVTEERWRAGKDMDIFVAVSFKVKRVVGKYLRIIRYSTFGPECLGPKFVLREDLSATPVPRNARLQLTCFAKRLLEGIPVVKHLGKAIFILATKDR